MLSASRKLRYGVGKYVDNPFRRFVSTLQSYDGFHKMYGLAEMNDPKVDSLPFSIRIILENVMRHCDQFQVKSIDVLKVLNWQEASKERFQIPFKPARVLLQDFTGVSVMVDLAALRDAMKQIGGDPLLINPQCPVHLVIDHSVQAEVTKGQNVVDVNEKIQFQINKERFEFLKWGSRAFKNLKIVPPGGGILHQINLEYLAEVLMKRSGFIFPDTVVGSDTHTSMINGLGVLGWGVGGLEAEAVMLGQPIPILLPKVVGVKLNNKLRQGVTASDLVLTLTRQFRSNNVQNKFLEFYGSGVNTLSIPQRATVANMAHEYGATVAYFPVDSHVIDYLVLTNKRLTQVSLVENGLRSLKLFRTKQSEETIKYSSTMEIDLEKIEPSVAGPNKPFDWVPLRNVKENWSKWLVYEKGGETIEDKEKIHASYDLKTEQYQQKLGNGSVIIASIDSCTNTSNPKVMIAAGLLARNAVSKGLKVKSYVKASISPGSEVVTEYFEKSKLLDSLRSLGFQIAGYGCMTCIGNSGQIDKHINELVKKQDLIVCSVTSGNANYQSKLHRRVKSNYLMSPAYVVAYSIAGKIDLDFQKEPLGFTPQNSPVYLKDIFPTDQEVAQVMSKSITSEMFQNVYDTIYSGTRRWNSIIIQPSVQYQWKKESTYIQKPPYLQNIGRKPKGIQSIKNAFVLAYFGDEVSTDLISPSGRILKNSLAGKFLEMKGVERKDYNTYGARRGNFDVLTRGTFSNPIIINRLAPSIGPKTTFVPTGEVLDFLDAAKKYQELGHSTLIIAGKEYGKGSVKDWAARGPYLLGVRAVIAQSYDQRHRLNLIEMGILPLQFMPQQSASTLEITGKQTFTINIPNKNLQHAQTLTVSTNIGRDFQCRSRLDSDLEIQYYRHGGILPYNLRKLRNAST